MLNQDVNVGGQAVIEGVMIRSDKYIAVAVRRPDGKIALKREENRPWGKRLKILRIPLIRGGVILIESIIHGIRALSWSAEIAVEDENEKSNASAQSQNSWKSKLGTFISITFAFGIGLFLFFWLPIVLTNWTGDHSGFAFNVIDGLFRLLLFGLYLGLISMWKEIRRIFQYHGAEHKIIYALGNDCPLTVDGARPFSTLHPRCGTSFLFVVIIVSMVVFMFLGKPDTYPERFIRLLFVPLIGGISYEFLRLSSKFRDNRIARILILPGLWLQKITTGEPSDDQLEVGLIALRSAIGEMLDIDNVIHYDSNGVIRTVDPSAKASQDENVLFSSHDN